MGSRCWLQGFAVVLNQTETLCSIRQKPQQTETSKRQKPQKDRQKPQKDRQKPQKDRKDRNLSRQKPQLLPLCSTRQKPQQTEKTEISKRQKPQKDRNLKKTEKTETSADRNLSSCRCALPDRNVVLNQTESSCGAFIT